MQFYALENAFPVLASQAKKQIDYQCPECAGIVRLRKGTLRQAHFYHLKSASSCHQQGKSATHLHIQLVLQRLLPPGEARMEQPFSEISRIADVAWEKEKIVFEIQCSPLSLHEAQARCSDYQKIGYTPVWILHERRFNKRKLSAAESLLRKIGCYYTNMDEKGHGEFYDQFDICRKEKRLFRGPNLQIDLRKPARFSEEMEDPPEAILTRLNHLSLYFSGDLLARFALEKSPSMSALEKKFITSPAQPFSFFEKVKQFYKIFFRLALEKVCR